MWGVGLFYLCRQAGAKFLFYGSCKTTFGILPALTTT